MSAETFMLTGSMGCIGAWSLRNLVREGVRVVALQYADDVARIFIACARSGYQGATACNLRKDVVDVGDCVTMVKAKYPQAQVTYNADNLLPFPYDLDDSGLRGILGKAPHKAIDESVAIFSQLIANGRIDLKQLEA